MKRHHVTTLALCIALAGCTQVIRKTEPAAGTLSTGQKVLVDDGSCAVGQVKEVTGGAPGVPRQKRCVPRPAS